MSEATLDEQPFVTVILPVYNEEKYIERSLGHVLAQSYPAELMEILIVDGMSTDKTRDIVAAFAAQDSRIMLLDNPKRIVPYALNRALRRAKGEIIVRVDGHCEIAPDYVAQCVEQLLSNEADGVGGPIETIGETPVAQAIAAAMSSRFGMGGSAFRTIKDRAIWVETVAFPAYRYSTIKRIGLFDEELVRNQDDEYNYRLLKNGGRVLLTPAIRSTYYSRGSLSKLWRQFYQYGYWKVRVLQKHPRQMRWRQFVPFGLVAALCGSLLFPFVLTPLIVGVYLLADLLASAQLARDVGWRQFGVLLLAYPAMHLAYGAGFAVGLVRFANRWGDQVGQVPDFAPNE